MLRSGPLSVAYSGPPVSSANPLCLFDGHLDNAAEICRELDESHGIQESARSEEQLLALAYRRWGIGFLERIRGDFVLLLWDADREEGLVARDHLGVRPLFVYKAGGALRFAGEIRDLLALLNRRPELDSASVTHWIAASTRPGTYTLFSGVRRLGPGEALLLGRDVRSVRYWAPSFQEPRDRLAPELAEEIAESIWRRGAPSPRG